MTIDIGIFQILPLKQADPATVARIAEDLGFNSYWVPEHAILPVVSDSTFTGRATAATPPIPEYYAHMPDPWIALSRAAAVTNRIRLGTAICLVPEHNPLILANAIASLDHYCDGRVNFGIGAGWNREEGEILGVDFDHRWTQTRECIEVMKELWTKDAGEYHGKYYDFPAVQCFPKPAQRPHPPIYLGSMGAKRVFKRVVDYGDGWVPVVQSSEQVRRGVAKIAENAAAAGRKLSDFSIKPVVMEGQFRTRADREVFAEAGADELIIWLQGKSVKDIIPELKALAKELLGGT